MVSGGAREMRGGVAALLAVFVVGVTVGGVAVWCAGAPRGVVLREPHALQPAAVTRATPEVVEEGTERGAVATTAAVATANTAAAVATVRSHAAETHAREERQLGRSARAGADWRAHDLHRRTGINARGRQRATTTPATPSTFIVDAAYLAAQQRALDALWALCPADDCSNTCGWTGASIEQTCASSAYCITGAVLELYLYGCGLSGSIPPELGNLTLLVVLVLSSNQLSGTIPPELGSMTQLAVLVLSSNQLSGTIPPELGTLLQLEELDLHNNQLDGCISEFVLAQPFIGLLDLSSNKLTGNLRGILSSFVAIGILDVSGNSLSGDIGGGISVEQGAAAISTLRASDNCFHTGLAVVPQSNMGSVSLADNCLEDDLQEALSPNPAIPFTGLFSLQLDNNPGLTGFIPTIQRAYLPYFSVLSLQNTSSLHANSSCTSNSTSSGSLAALESSCLSVDLVLSRSSFQSIGSSDLVQCAAIVARNANELTAVIDIGYLNYAQCTCTATAYRGNSTGSPPQCYACPQDNGGWCQCSFGRLTGCYPAQNASGYWAAVPCPLLGSQSDRFATTACNPTTVPLDAVSAVGGHTTSFACGPGYEGRLCAQCSDAHYRVGYQCQQCSGTERWLLPLAYAVVAALLVAYLLVVPGKSSGEFKIGVFYVQLLYVLVQSPGVGWPSFVQQFLHSSSKTISLSLAAVACFVPGVGPTGQLAMQLVMPLVLLSAVGAVGLLRLLWLRWKKHDARGWVDQVVYALLSVLQVTWFNVVTEVLAALSCTRYDAADPSTWYSNQYPAMACDPHRLPFRSVLPLAVVGLLVVVAGVPVLFAVLMCRQRRALHRGLYDQALRSRRGSALSLPLLVASQLDEKEEERSRAASSAIAVEAAAMYGAQERWAARLAGLCAHYRPDLFWWELVAMLQRFLIALTLALVPFVFLTLPSVLIVLQLAVAVWLLHTLEPFYESGGGRWLHRLALTTAYTLLVSFVLVQLDLAQRMEWVLWVILVANVGGVITLAAVIAKQLWGSSASMRAAVAQRCSARRPAVASSPTVHAIDA